MERTKAMAVRPSPCRCREDEDNDEDAVCCCLLSRHWGRGLGVESGMGWGLGRV
jgi:hypothetical protein